MDDRIFFKDPYFTININRLLSTDLHQSIIYPTIIFQGDLSTGFNYPSEILFQDGVSINRYSGIIRVMIDESGNTKMIFSSLTTIERYPKWALSLYRDNTIDKILGNE